MKTTAIILLAAAAAGGVYLYSRSKKASAVPDTSNAMPNQPPSGVNPVEAKRAELMNSTDSQGDKDILSRMTDEEILVIYEYMSMKSRNQAIPDTLQTLVNNVLSKYKSQPRAVPGPVISSAETQVLTLPQSPGGLVMSSSGNTGIVATVTGAPNVLRLAGMSGLYC